MAKLIIGRMRLERDQLRREADRLREGLRRLKDKSYNIEYSPEGYADAVLSGYEPQDLSHA